MSYCQYVCEDGSQFNLGIKSPLKIRVATWWDSAFHKTDCCLTGKTHQKLGHSILNCIFFFKTNLITITFNIQNLQIMYLWGPGEKRLPSSCPHAKQMNDFYLLAATCFTITLALLLADKCYQYYLHVLQPPPHQSLFFIWCINPNTIIELSKETSDSQLPWHCATAKLCCDIHYQCQLDNEVKQVRSKTRLVDNS